MSFQIGAIPQAVACEIHESFKNLPRVEPVELLEMLERMGMPPAVVGSAVVCFMQHTQRTLLPAEFARWLFPGTVRQAQVEHQRDAAQSELQVVQRRLVSAQADIEELHTDRRKHEVAITNLLEKLSTLTGKNESAILDATLSSKVAMLDSKTAALSFTLPIRTTCTSALESAGSRGLPLTETIVGPMRVSPESLIAAAERNDAEMVLFLVDQGVDPNSASSGDVTALHLSAWRGNAELAERLLEARADASARDERGKTPLHCAAYNGREEACARLLARGADPKALTHKGESPADWAEFHGHTTAAKLLREAEARRA